MLEAAATDYRRLLLVYSRAAAANGVALCGAVSAAYLRQPCLQGGGSCVSSHGLAHANLMPN